jgi:hypothetical protein
LCCWLNAHFLVVDEPVVLAFNSCSVDHGSWVSHKPTHCAACNAHDITSPYLSSPLRKQFNILNSVDANINMYDISVCLTNQYLLTNSSKISLSCNMLQNGQLLWWKMLHYAELHSNNLIHDYMRKHVKKITLEKSAKKNKGRRTCM